MLNHRFPPTAARFPVLALIEVLAVFAAGSVLGFLLAHLSGIPLRNPLLLLVDHPEQPLLPLALELATVLGWQYLGWGCCAALMYWLKPRLDGLPAVDTKSCNSRLRNQIGFIAAVTALAAAPSLALSQAQEIWQLGVRSPWFNVLQQREWDASFWLFMAVGSYGLIPVVEELFYRGYLFRRLAGAGKPILAVAFSASLFACSHAQYLQLDLFNAAMLINVAYIGILLALATWYSGSLWPAIIAHAVLNLPMTWPVAALLIAMAVFGLSLTWSRWQAFRRFVGNACCHSPAQWLLGLSLGAGFALLFHRYSFALAYSAMPVLLVLLGIRIWQRLRAPAAAMVSKQDSMG